MKKMKNLFAFGHKSDPKVIDKSMDTIEDLTERVTKEVQELEKRIRIETEIGKNGRLELAAEKIKTETIDRQLTDARREEKYISQEIDQRSKSISLLTKSNDELTETIRSLEVEAIRKKKQYNDKIQHLLAVKEQYENDFRNKRLAYKSLTESLEMTSIMAKSLDGKELEKKKTLIAIKKEIEAIERQIKEIDETKTSIARPETSESPLSEDALANFGNPYLVVLRIAQIKLSSNGFQRYIDDFIQNEMVDQQTNDFNPIEDNNRDSEETNIPSTSQTVLQKSPNISMIGEKDEEKQMTTKFDFGLFDFKSPDSDPIVSFPLPVSQTTTTESGESDKLFPQLGSGFGTPNPNPNQNDVNIFNIASQTPTGEQTEGFSFFGSTATSPGSSATGDGFKFF